MASTHLAPPWVIEYRMIDQLFKYDKDVRVIYDNDEKTVSLYVEGAAKAEALAEILPNDIEFGSVQLTIKVIPANPIDINQSTVKTRQDIFADAFKDNPIVERMIPCVLFERPILYILFRKKVVQFYTDDLSDYGGISSTLYESIAKHIFTEGIDGVFFCTSTKDLEDELSVPLGEWP